MSDVSSVMTANPACCKQDTPLQQVAQMMIDNDCGQIPVVDAANKPIGVVTDRDIAIRAVANASCDVSKATAKDAMTSPVKTVRHDMPLKDAVCMMEAEKVRRIPVVSEDGTLAGIVAIADLALAGKSEATAEAVRKISQPGK